MTALGDRFTNAMTYAAELHADQRRKGGGIPYVSHLLAVASLVLEQGGDEDQAIAALLHDAVEDQGGLDTLAEIKNRFGDRVARIVDECSDAHTDPKPPWQQRKDAYIATVGTASPDARLVSIADKLHNARTILADYREGGETLWDRFKGGRAGTLRYYRALVTAYSHHGRSPLLAELDRTVCEIERLAGQSGAETAADTV
jgi:(p)ppGpp synthase/HD superfamily hydrolase